MGSTLASNAKITTITTTTSKQQMATNPKKRAKEKERSYKEIGRMAKGRVGMAVKMMMMGTENKELETVKNTIRSEKMENPKEERRGRWRRGRKELGWRVQKLGKVEVKRLDS